MTFDETVCRDLDVASRREWLETNGIGGYASSTICGMNTRRYHGLLVAALKPPVGRMVLLSKIEETLTVNGKSYELSVNQYPGAVHPQGYRYLSEVRLDPFPMFSYEVEGIRLEKSIFMPQAENTVVIRYELHGQPEQCTLELRPLLAFRDYHSTTHENGAINPGLLEQPGCVRFTPYPDLPSLYLAHNAAEVRAAGVWFRNFEFERERERGLDYREDLFQPCVLTTGLQARGRVTVIAATEVRDVKSADELLDLERRRRVSIAGSVPSDPPFASTLAVAADQFLVKRGSGSTVIAGYHWFSDWGRDTMIALPGLTLTTKRPELARGILLAFAGVADRGMLPNRFPDAGETPEYNTADATLWFFEAARAYLAHTGDLEFVRSKLYDVLADSIAWHERGTRYGIHVDHDGLLHAGEAGVQLTWMDAKVGDWVVTPRMGKPVEIQALWYNALRIMEELSRSLSREADANRYRELAERAAASFGQLFWNPAANCLYDVVDGETRDASIRPNQIFALSLPHRMVSAAQAAGIVATVEKHLLTPFGLRTLSPADPQYRGRYHGDPRSRDGAYHQGTVWPWLMGPFVRAYLNVNGRSLQSRKQAAAWLSELVEFVQRDGAGHLPEVFDGDPPHRPGGCISQAWSVAEILRVCLEDS